MWSVGNLLLLHHGEGTPRGHGKKTEEKIKGIFRIVKEILRIKNILTVQIIK